MMQRTRYTCKIHDSKQDLVFTHTFVVDTSSLAAAVPTIVGMVDRLNTTDRRPTGTYVLRGIEKSNLIGDIS